MRAREILQEDYNESLESDLNNLLIGAKGAGAQEIKTQDLVTQLQGMGYSVTDNSLMLLLSRNPAVLNATPTFVRLADPEGAAFSGSDPAQDTAARVGDMAQKATKLK
jgi:hypothetical protein